MHSLFASILANNNSLLRVADTVVVEELLKTDALVARLLFDTSLGATGSFDVDDRLSQLNGERRTGVGFSWTGVDAVGIALRFNVGAGDDDLPLELVGAVCDETVEERENRVKIDVVVDSGVTEDASLDEGSSSIKETSSKEDVEILR